MRALAARSEPPTPATTCSERARSTSAPPGIWPTSEIRPEIDRTRPISTCVHCCVVRYTATNGPKPVCTSATRKTNQSSLFRLRREGCGGEGGEVSVTDGLLRQRFEITRRAEYDSRFAFLVFRRRLHLVARELEDDAVALFCGRH